VTHVYKILPATEWSAAGAQGSFTGSAIDLEDGYIHLSSATQAAETARLHFAGRDGLVLVQLRAEDFGEALKWEASRGGALFPHLYAALDPARALAVHPLPLNTDGWPDPGPLTP